MATFEVPSKIHVEVINTPAASDAFDQAFGRFMLMWADAELAVYRVLVYYTRVSDGVARAIFSGTRTSAAIKYLKAIAANGEIPEARQADLDFVFAQMGTINTMRDFIAHHGSGLGLDWIDDNTRQITDGERVSRYGNAWPVEVTPAAMTRMGEDLRTIRLHLNQHLKDDARSAPFTPWRSPSDKHATWRYKSPQPRSPGPKSAPSVRKRKSQPQPSPPK